MRRTENPLVSLLSLLVCMRSPGLIYESASPFSSRSLSLIARYTLLGRAWTRLLLAISHSSRDLARAITARKLFGTVWHTRPIHRTRICIYSGPSFHEDFSWRWILTAKASQLERITRLFGILSGEPCRREDDVIIIVVLFFFIVTTAMIRTMTRMVGWWFIWMLDRDDWSLCSGDARE